MTIHLSTNPCERCGFQPVVEPSHYGNVEMMQIYCEQCGIGICYAVDENPVRIWNARNAIKRDAIASTPIAAYTGPVSPLAFFSSVDGCRQSLRGNEIAHITPDGTLIRNGVDITNDDAAVADVFREVVSAMWTAGKPLIKPAERTPKPGPVYIYVFEDGEVAKHSEPPTEVDLVCVFQGTLQIIKVDNGKATQYVTTAIQISGDGKPIDPKRKTVDLPPIPTAVVDRDAETGEPYHYHEQERTAF